MTRIDWTPSAATVSRIVRAYDPRPGAYARALDGGANSEVKLFGARLSARETDRLPGEILAIDDEGMTVSCGPAANRGQRAVPCKSQACNPPESAPCRRASGRAAAASPWASGYLKHHAWRRSAPIARRSFRRW